MPSFPPVLGSILHKTEALQKELVSSEKQVAAKFFISSQGVIGKEHLDQSEKSHADVEEKHEQALSAVGHRFVCQSS